MHLPGCIVVVTGCGDYYVNSGTLLQSTTSISKSISD